MLCERKCNVDFVKDIEIHGDGNVCSAAKRSEKAEALILMLGLNEAVDQLTVANGVHC